MSKSSNSVGNIRGIFPWLFENFMFFKMRLVGLKNSEAGMNALLTEIDGYARRYSEMTGHKLADANVLEIGYGARPNRLIAMISLGYKAKGIDLDRPILSFGISELFKTYKSNGIKRALKSLVRSLLFDGHERRSLDRTLRKRGAMLKIDKTRFLVGDASTFTFPASSIDFLYSEDVFEHIPPPLVHALCKNLSSALSANGLALVTPAIYSGIGGGHLVEWYPHTLDTEGHRQSEPWEHLRKRRFVADCYLNELRVGEFEKIFSDYFDVVDVINCNAGHGRGFLTQEIREELSQYSDDELLSDKWTFVLRKKVTGVQ